MKRWQLTKLEGIGMSTAQKTREYFGTERIEKLDELRKTCPADIDLVAPSTDPAPIMICLLESVDKPGGRNRLR